MDMTVLAKHGVDVNSATVTVNGRRSTDFTLPPAPKLTKLGWLLGRLPPVIARKYVVEFLGGCISPKKLANDDSRGQGPLVRITSSMGVSYPTDFLLAYLEAEGVSVIVKPKI